MKIGFTQSIIRQDRTAPKLSAVEAFDDYFFLSGRKYKVLDIEARQDGNKNFGVMGEDVESNIPLNILKVISYCTGIVPLIMLIGKAIARSQYEFRDYDQPTLCIQNFLRAKEAQQAYQKMLKAKERILKINQEISDSEGSHFELMVQNLEVMNNKAFNDVLKKPNELNKKFMNDVLGNYLVLIGKGTKVQKRLNAIVAPAPTLVEPKKFDAIVNQKEAARRDVPVSVNPIDATKKDASKEADEKQPPIVQAVKSAEQMRKEVQDICTFIMDKDFDEYMRLLIKVSACSADFDELIDIKKRDSLLTSLNKPIATFGPCVNPCQRIARYPLLLKELRKEVEIIGLSKELSMLNQTIELLESHATVINMIEDIRVIKKMINTYKEAHSKIKIFNGDAKNDSIAKIKYYLNQNKAAFAALKEVQTVPKTELEMQLRQARLALLELKLD
jgi:hypothetical protein